jgi:hypothetical protein
MIFCCALASIFQLLVSDTPSGQKQSAPLLTNRKLLITFKLRDKRHAFKKHEKGTVVGLPSCDIISSVAPFISRIDYLSVLIGGRQSQFTIKQYCKEDLRVINAGNVKLRQISQTLTVFPALWSYRTVEFNK